ncbi:MAG: potassium transporter [Gammaproteobacteria bacterium]|nr:potassium transporter [Gammaproteobacteria bacterium]
MHIKHILRLLGMMLIFFSLSMIPPLFVNGWYHEDLQHEFSKSFLIIFLLGLGIWYLCRKSYKEIQIHDGFLLVILFWVFICLSATLPFKFILHDKITWLDAFFECASGLTTTGVTVFTYPEQLPKSLLYYRQQLTFLGGMSIIVLTIAIMPMLGVGGTRIYRTETPGAFKDTKFTPRITQTAKALWAVYLFLTLSCIIYFRCVGLSWFEAICEGFPTISTGGLVTQSQGFSYYHNAALEWGAPIFMLCGSINFATHFMALKKRNILHYWGEEELRFFIFVILGAVILGALMYFQRYQAFSIAHFRHIFFTTISLISSSGASCVDYSQWPLSFILMLLILSIFGGCHGSTSGGMKMIRILILSKLYNREIKVLLHPQLISPLKYNNKPIDNSIIMSLFSFTTAFITLFVFLIFLLALGGNDLMTCLAIVTGTLTNSGISLGSISLSYEHINPYTKFISILSMLAGRLEIFSLFIICSIPFWEN